MAQFVGLGPHIREDSLLQNASKIKVPMLLVHGDMDESVGVNGSLKMEAALKQSGASVQLIRYKSLDHQLDDSVARRERLTSIGTLSQKTIGQ